MARGRSRRRGLGGGRGGGGSGRGEGGRGNVNEQQNEHQVHDVVIEPDQNEEDSVEHDDSGRVDVNEQHVEHQNDDVVMNDVEPEQNEDEFVNPPRGQTRGVRAPQNPQDRLVAPIKNTFLTPQPGNKASVLMKSAISECWLLWKNVPKEVREHAFSEFLTYFRFPEGKEKQGRKVFMTFCATNYSKWWSKARKEAMKKAKTWPRLTEACKRYKPEWISEKLWIEFVDKWMNGDYEKKREQCQKNRSKLTLNHTGGSAPFEAHAEKLKKKKGKTPTQLEKWKFLHKKKQGNGEWISEKAKQIAEDYAARMAEITEPHEAEDVDANPGTETSENPGPAFDNLVVWSEVTGGRSKNRLIGFGPHVKANAILGKNTYADAYETGSPTTGSSVDGFTQDNFETALDAALDRRGIRPLDPGRNILNSIDQEGLKVMINEAVERRYREEPSTSTSTPVLTLEQVRDLMAEEIQNAIAATFTRILPQLSGQPNRKDASKGDPPGYTDIIIFSDC